MADMKVSNAAPVQAAPAEAKPEKAQSAFGKFMSGLRDAVFGETGAAIIAGAASGALIGGIPGAVVGGVTGLGIASAVKASREGKTGWAMLNAAASGAVLGLAFTNPVSGLLVGGAAFAFGSGAAQKAASKIAGFLGLHKGDTPAPQPMPAPAQ